LSFIDRVLIISVRQRSLSAERNQPRSFPQTADSFLGLGSVIAEETVSATKYPRADIDVFLDCHPK
jgi:hypothetical protein